jgi:hypothetical protein
MLWAGRAVALLASLFFLVFLIGEGAAELTGPDAIPTELAVFLPMMALALLGFVLSFFRIKAGAILQIAGGGAMLLYHLIRGGIANFSTALLLSIPYLFCGIVSLLYHRKSHNQFG